MEIPRLRDKNLFSILIFPAPIALLAGILAAVDLKRHPGTHGMGRAVFAIVMGGIFTIPLILIVVGLLTSAVGS